MWGENTPVLHSGTKKEPMALSCVSVHQFGLETPYVYTGFHLTKTENWVTTVSLIAF